jgi:hypothetical protein
MCICWVCLHVPPRNFSLLIILLWSRLEMHSPKPVLSEVKIFLPENCTEGHCRPCEHCIY